MPHAWRVHACGRDGRRAAEVALKAERAERAEAGLRFTESERQQQLARDTWAQSMAAQEQLLTQTREQLRLARLEMEGMRQSGVTKSGRWSEWGESFDKRFPVKMTT